MNPAELVAALAERGISLQPLSGDQIKIRGADKLTSAEAVALRTHKPELLTYLRAANRATSAASLRVAPETKSVSVEVENADAKPTGDAVFWRIGGGPWHCIGCHPNPPKGARWYTLPTPEPVPEPQPASEPPEPAGPCPACHWSSFWLDTSVGLWRCGRCCPRPYPFYGASLVVESGATSDSEAEVKAEREAIQALNDDLCAKRTSDRPKMADSPSSSGRSAPDPARPVPAAAPDYQKATQNSGGE